MMKSILKLAGAAALAFAAGAPAQAATFVSESGFGTDYCKTLSNTTAFATGIVLDATHLTDNSCTGFYGVSIDTSAQTITLTSLEFGNYDSNYLSITDITGLTITGLSTISYTSLFDPEFYGEPETYGAIPVPTLSFTASSIRIGFSSEGGSPPQFTFAPIEAGGTAVFAYTTAAIPEPASWAMLIAGFGLVGAAMRRRALAAA